MEKKVMAKKGDSKKAPARTNGNITVDLGEAIDRKLRSAMGKDKPERESIGYSGGFRPGGYRPGMYGWKPYGAERPSRFGGSINRWRLGDSSPFGISRQVSTMQGLTGIGIGLVFNRALMRVSPSIVKTSNLIAHSGIAFVVGLIPVLVKQNSVTLGVALPGAVYLGGSIIDWALDSVGIARPALSGSAPLAGGAAPAAGVGQAIQARQRLVDLQNKIRPAQAAAPMVRPQVIAQQRIG
ncbi:MAG TPA: hypothetical protein VEN81_01890 [Planctomycetota bacterium]|nr:hypothetical protein [Planctomycetota bacterium]